MGADDDDRPPKRSRTGDVEPDIDPSPPTGPEWLVSLRVSQALIRAPTVNKPDYSGGRLTSSCSPFFDVMRFHLGRFLVDKTKLIEDIVNCRMGGIIDLVLRPRRCGKSSMLQMMK